MDPHRTSDLPYVAEVAGGFLNLRDSDGAIGVREHEQFWMVAADTPCTCYLTALFAKLVALEKGDYKTPLAQVVHLIQRGEGLPADGSKPTKGDKTPPPDAARVLQQKAAILTTLYMFALYFPFDPHSGPFSAALRAYAAAVDGDGGAGGGAGSSGGMGGSTGGRRETLRGGGSQVGIAGGDSSNFAGASSGGLRTTLGALTPAAFVGELKRMFSPAGLGSNEGVISLVDRCCDIIIAPSFDWWNDPGRDCHAAFLSQSFVHGFLRNVLARGDASTSNVIFDKLLLFLRHPGISERRLLSLLHMLKVFITQSGAAHTDILSGALSTVRQYYIWPKPAGAAAHQLLQLLTLEKKSPGLALRQSLLSEHPELRPRAEGTSEGTGLDLRGSGTVGTVAGAAAAGADGGGGGAASLGGGVDFRPVSGFEKTVHVLVDNLSIRAKQVQKLLEGCQPPSTPIAQLRLNLLANIIGTALQVPVESLDAQYLTEAEAVDVYEAATGVLAAAIRAPTQEDAEAMKQRELGVLRQSIAAVAGPRRQAGQPPTFLPPRYPALTPLNFRFRLVNCNNTAPVSHESPFAKRSSVVLLQDILSSYAGVVSEIRSRCGDAELVRKPTVQIALIGGDNLLHNMAASWAYISATDPPAGASNAGAGAGAPTAAAAAAQSGASAARPGADLLSALEVRFFFVPVDRSEFGRYLGTHDPWYGRNVIGAPLCALATMPSVTAAGGAAAAAATGGGGGGAAGAAGGTGGAGVLQRQHRPTLLSSLANSSGGMAPTLGAGGSPSGGGMVALSPGGATSGPVVTVAEGEDPVLIAAQPPSPGRLLRDELQYFVREARHRLEANVWLCECTTAAGGARPDFVLPFVVRCDLGVRAAAAAFQAQRDLPVDWSLPRVAEQKGFKSPPISATVKHTLVTLTGAERPGPTFERSSYSSISISSVPLVDGELSGVSGGPTQPCVEVSLADSEAPKRRKKTQPYIGGEAAQHAGITALHACVVEIEATDKKKPFNILLDGVPQGPFHKIRVTRARAPNFTPAAPSYLTMPLMTVLPIERRG